MCLHFDQIAHGDDVWDSLSSACTSMWSLWKLFHPVRQWLKSSEPINCALFSKAKPFRSPRLISLNSFRNVAPRPKVFAPFLFIAFDRQNEFFFPFFSVAAFLSFTLSWSDSQLRIVGFLIVTILLLGLPGYEMINTDPALCASLVIYHFKFSTP